MGRPLNFVPSAFLMYGLLLACLTDCSASSSGAEVQDTSAEGGSNGDGRSASGGNKNAGGLGGQLGEETAEAPELSGSAGELQYEVRECPEGTVGFAEEVISFEGGEGQDFGRDKLPDIVLGGPLGGGCCAGSFDVASLGNGGTITLGFGQRSIVDGAGSDFIVFENAFWAGGNEDAAFVELGLVEVSPDGEEWFSFPCDEISGEGCSGRTPTLAHPQNSDVSVFNPTEAGGDAFDLAELGLPSAKFIRISDLPDDDMGFDLDAVAVVHGRCD